MDPSSSTSHERKKYDVFLSFRGSDTRCTFTSHVYAALQRKNIATFIDNDLNRGEEISPAILSTIEQSKVALIIFSQNYASSPWCLEELEHILRCRETKGQIVLPVFYQVNPSHVGEQIGDFGVAFLTLKEKFKENMENWKGALTEAGNLSGWVSYDVRPESKLIEAIVKDILKKLSPLSPRRSTSLVGIDLRIEHIISLLCMDSLDVRIVGIWGMGGIGKTTIARAVFNQISAHFEGVHFLPNVRDELRRCSLIQLQNKLLSRVLNEESQDVDTLSLEDTFLMERLGRTKVLIVLDDVDDSIEVLELLGGQRDLFGQGSRILITSRDKQVLKNVADKIYKVEGLNPSEALQLFSLNAFKKNYPTSDDLVSSERIVNYAQGNPLALRVLGLALYDRSKKDWASTLSKLSNVSNAKILNVLRISYDGLDSEEKKIFLDIACFFKGERQDYVTDILESYYSSAHLSISILEDKSLITINDEKLEMHDLLQQMGRSIVCDESTEDPGKRSRLWHSDDIHYLLSKKKGTGAIEGIFLDVTNIRQMKLTSDVFARMVRLRLLKICGTCKRSMVLFPRGLTYLPSCLRYLHWDRFPLKSLPSGFTAENLVELNLPHSKLRNLWTGVKRLDNLKRIDLRHSKDLAKLPDLSQAYNVVRINLEGCESLVEVTSSIQSLNQLEYLILKGCRNLSSDPTKICSESLKVLDLSHCSKIKSCPEMISRNLEELYLIGTAIKEVPESICQLELLRVLCLNGCSSITEFPESSRKIEKLFLAGTAIPHVPSSLQHLASLAVLDMRFCRNLSNLPGCICELRCLKSLDLSGCSNLESLPENFRELSQLYGLGLQYCMKLISLPELPSSLESLMASDCRWLGTISNGSKCNLIKANFSNCRTLSERSCSRIIANAHLATQLMTTKFHQDRIKCAVICPGSEIPLWFRYVTWRPSISMRLPSNRPQIKGVAFCVVFGVKNPLHLEKFDNDCCWIKEFNCRYRVTSSSGEHHKGKLNLFWDGSFSEINLVESDHVLIAYHPRLKKLVGSGSEEECWSGRFSGDEISFEFYAVTCPLSPVSCWVKKCGVVFLQDDAEAMNIASSSV